jgi:hypothetical protein
MNRRSRSDSESAHCRFGLGALSQEAPLVGTAEADPGFCSQFSEGTTVLEVLIDEPEPALLCQPGIGMAMHGCVRSGSMGRTSTRSGLTPSCQLTNLLRQNT